MSLKKRLQQLEKTLNEINSPTQEKLVCQYLQSVEAYFKGTEEAKAVEDSFEQVKENIVRLH